LSASIVFVDMLVLFLVVLGSIAIFCGWSDASRRTFAVLCGLSGCPLLSCALFSSTAEKLQKTILSGKYR